MQKFIRAGDETKSWMSEKETALLSDDYGRDLASVQALQRKHEGLERDLDALEEKVKLLGMDSAQLVGAQPKSGKVIRDKEKEIVDSWSTLKSRVRRSNEDMKKDESIYGSVLRTLFSCQLIC